MGVTENRASPRQQPDRHAGRVWKQTGCSWWVKEDGWGAGGGAAPWDTPSQTHTAAAGFPDGKGLLGGPRMSPGCPQGHSSWLGAEQVKAPAPHRLVCVRAWEVMDRGLFPKISLILQEKYFWSACFVVQREKKKKKKIREPTARDVYLPHDRTPRDCFWILLLHVKRPDSIKELISSFPSTEIHGRPKIKPDFPRLVQSCAELGNMQSRQVFIESHPRLLSKVVFSRHICLEDFCCLFLFFYFQTALFSGK